jgi:hypothetical protein
LKTISEDGGLKSEFDGGNDMLPTAKLRTVIDRDLFTPARPHSGR